jgi:hypothetical protein
MPELHKPDPIDVLVSQRFPDVEEQPPPEDQIDRRQSWRAAQQYRAELEKMPSEALDRLLLSGHSITALTYSAIFALRENALFFHQPQAKADFDHWARVPWWTLDEAVALSFGREPGFVNWESIQPYCGGSQFAKEYERRRRIVVRFQAINQLSDPVFPGIFLEWAKQSQTDFPIALEQAVETRWGQVIDWRKLFYDQDAYNKKEIENWKALCEALQEQRDQFAAKAGNLEFEVEERDQCIAQLHAYCENLEAASIENESAVIDAEDKPLHTKEYESLQKMVIGLAIGGYGYDSSAKRNSTVKEMVDDMESAGINISDDTVRKFLRKGMQYLPQDRETERPDR